MEHRHWVLWLWLRGRQIAPPSRPPGQGEFDHTGLPCQGSDAFRNGCLVTTLRQHWQPQRPHSLLQAPVMTRPERNSPFGCHSQGFKQTIAIGQSAVTGIEHHTFLNSRVPLVPPKPKELDRA